MRQLFKVRRREMSYHPRYILPVRDVSKQLDRKVNLIGVVVEFSIPHRSEGTDYCTILKIVDASQHTPELCVNIFTENICESPHIRSYQDFIFLSNVWIKSHKQEVYAVFNKKFSSFALFDGKLSHGFSPYQASPTFCLLDSDKGFVTQMKDWRLTFSFDAGISGYTLTLNDMREREYIDLVCMVLHVYEVSKDKWVLFLWDGTDAPPLSLNSKLLDEAQIQLPLQIGSQLLPVNILRKFPRVGTVLRVIAGRACEQFGHHFQYVGKWMRIRNLFCRTKTGVWKGHLTPSTKVRLLSDKDNSVRECLRNFEKRISEHGRVPLSSCHVSNFFTVTDHEHVNFLTLMDLLTVSQSYGRFQCVVRVVAVYPSQVKDFCSPSGQYRIRMTLEDPTARVHALLCGEDAEIFFGGYPAVDVLTTKMNKLLGVPEGEGFPMNPPWIKCCIELHSQCVGGVSGSRHYHIRCTRLVV